MRTLLKSWMPRLAALLGVVALPLLVWAETTPPNYSFKEYGIQLEGQSYLVVERSGRDDAGKSFWLRTWEGKPVQRPDLLAPVVYTAILAGTIDDAPLYQLLYSAEKLASLGREARNHEWWSHVKTSDLSGPTAAAFKTARRDLPGWVAIESDSLEASRLIVDQDSVHHLLFWLEATGRLDPQAFAKQVGALRKGLPFRFHYAHLQRLLPFVKVVFPVVLGAQAPSDEDWMELDSVIAGIIETGLSRTLASTSPEEVVGQLKTLNQSIGSAIEQSSVWAKWHEAASHEGARLENLEEMARRRPLDFVRPPTEGDMPLVEPHLVLRGLTAGGQDLMAAPTLTEADLDRGELLIRGSTVALPAGFQAIRATFRSAYGRTAPITLVTREERFTFRSRPQPDVRLSTVAFTFRFRPQPDVRLSTVAFTFVDSQGQTYESIDYPFTIRRAPRKIKPLAIKAGPKYDLLARSNTGEAVTLTPEDLSPRGEITFRGKVDDGRNGATVRRLEVNVGDGRGWHEVLGRMNWKFDFAPRRGYPYRVSLRAVDIHGNVQPLTESPVPVTFVAKLQEARLGDTVKEIWDAFRREDITRYFDHIAPDFAGSVDNTTFNSPEDYQDFIQKEFDDFSFTAMRIQDLDVKVVRDRDARGVTTVEYRRQPATGPAERVRAAVRFKLREQDGRWLVEEWLERRKVGN